MPRMIAMCIAKRYALCFVFSNLLSELLAGSMCCRLLIGFMFNVSCVSCGLSVAWNVVLN